MGLVRSSGLFLALSVLSLSLLFHLGCSSDPQIIEVVKEVPVDVVKEVVKEVPVEVIKEVAVDVIKEVPVEVEVVKEVPVNKVVHKEVPVETIHKELVYVPFFTDDPEYLEGNTQPEKKTKLTDGAEAAE